MASLFPKARYWQSNRSSIIALYLVERFAHDNIEQLEAGHVFGINTYPSGDGWFSILFLPNWELSLGVGFALDEGTPHPEARYNVFLGEPKSWWVLFTVDGAPGHSATLPKHTASQIAHGILAKALEFRKKQRAILENGVTLGDVISLNVAFFEAGVRDASQASGYISNMIPDTARVGFDIRVPPTIKAAEMDAEIESWTSCGDVKCPGVSVHFTRKVEISYTTNLSSDEWYANAFFDGFANAGIQREQLHIGICTGFTDALYISKLWVPAVGFSPITETLSIIHKHDKFI